MLKLAINHSLFPWSGAPQAYNSKLDFFLAAYLRFSVNGFGVCSVTYRDITEAIGLSTNDTHAVPKARKKINGVIRNLLSRKGELYAEDFITIGAPEKKECEIKNGEIFKIPVEDMHTHQKTPYILVDTDEFCKIPAEFRVGLCNFQQFFPNTYSFCFCINFSFHCIILSFV